jgi:hypothetical protein
MNAGIERINTVFEDMKAVAINIKAIFTKKGSKE